MPDYEVTLSTPSYTVYRVEARDEDEAVKMVWREDGDIKLVDSFLGTIRETHTHGVVDLDA